MYSFALLRLYFKICCVLVNLEYYVGFNKVAIPFRSDRQMFTVDLVEVSSRYDPVFG